MDTESEITDSRHPPSAGRMKGERIMFYVYCKHIKTGKEEFVNCYQTAQEAIEKIASNYNIDKRTCQFGEYYYFMKQH